MLTTQDSVITQCALRTTHFWIGSGFELLHCYTDPLNYWLAPLQTLSDPYCQSTCLAVTVSIRQQ